MSGEQRPGKSPKTGGRAPKGRTLFSGLSMLLRDLLIMNFFSPNHFHIMRTRLLQPGTRHPNKDRFLLEFLDGLGAAITHPGL